MEKVSQRFLIRWTEVTYDDDSDWEIRGMGNDNIFIDGRKLSPGHETNLQQDKEVNKYERLDKVLIHK